MGLLVSQKKAQNFHDTDGEVRKKMSVEYHRLNVSSFKNARRSGGGAPKDDNIIDETDAPTAKIEFSTSKFDPDIQDELSDSNNKLSQDNDNDRPKVKKTFKQIK